MRNIEVRVYSEKEGLPKEKQLAWYIAELASQSHSINRNSPEVEMVGNRILDNASVALAGINRHPVKTARCQAMAHPRKGGATIFGLGEGSEFHAEWASWANNVAVRELDFHDTFLAADYSHPGDNIPPILAVAQQKNRSGKDIVSGILTAYEIHVSLVKGICLHKHKVDHVAHLAASVVAGLGALLNLDTETIYHAINHAEHVCISTRQSRKGQISSWKAYAPAHCCKLAIEAVDRSMRGEKSPSPIWEGEDSIISSILDGKDAKYNIPLPSVAEPLNAILETYTKEHSAEYQAQAFIDLAFDLSKEIDDLEQVAEIIIHTNHHTHYVIGTGSGDPQKFDPDASRETLDHSIMYIFSVALEDGFWHHSRSYTPERAHRESTIRLWRKIRTVEDPKWTEKYHSADNSQKAFGGRVEVFLKDGSVIEAKKKVADAHPLGNRPFKKEQYHEKFIALADGIVEPIEVQRFFSLIDRLPKLNQEDLKKLNPRVKENILENITKDQQMGIF